MRTQRLVGNVILLGGRPRRWSWLQLRRILQWASPTLLRRLQQWKLVRLLRYVGKNVPFYYGLAKVEITVGNVSDVLQSLPLVDKDIIEAHFRDFLARGISPSRWIEAHTGGSTGRWFKFYHDKARNERRRSADLLGRYWAGWRVGEPYAIVWGHREDIANAGRGGGWARVGDHALVLNAYDLDMGAVEEFLERCEAIGPTLVMGYARALGAVARVAGKKGLSFGSRVRGVITTAETLQQEDAEAIEAYVGAPVLNRYGSREFGLIAQQCGPGRVLHALDDHVLIEILDAGGQAVKEGESGEIVVTDLDNYVMPLVRYRTGDAGRVSRKRCGCGRGYSGLERVEGRLSDILVGSNGKWYSCPGPRLFLRDTGVVRQMQIIQRSLDQVTVRVVPDSQWSEDARSRLAKRVQELLGLGTKVDIEEVERIPPAPSGKYRFVISTIETLPYLGPRED